MGRVGSADEPPPTHLNWAAARRLLGWLRPHAATLAVNIGLTLVLAGVDLLMPKLLKWTINDVARAVRPADPPAGASLAPAGPPRAEAGPATRPTDDDPRDAWRRIVTLFAVFAGILLVVQVVRHFEIRRVMAFSQMFMRQMRQRFFEHLHRLGLRYYDRMKAGQTIARGTADLETLEHSVSWAPNQLASAIVTIAGATVLLATEDRVLFLAVFPVVPLLALLTRWFRVRASGAWWQVRFQTGRLTANVAESIAGARVIQAFARMEKNEEIFRDLTDELYESRVETQRVQARYAAWLRALQIAAPLIVILVGAWRIGATAGLPEAERASAGSVVACLGYLWRLFFPMELLSELYNHFLHSLAALDRVLEVLDEPPEIVDAPDAASPPDFEGEVAFEDVTFWYTPGAPVLREVTFRVRPGEVIALVGPTGAGKTTICRLIARFYEAQRGVVRIDEWDVRRIAQAALHRRTGIVLQENFLFAGTVMDNIRYGRPTATDEELVQCARQIGSHAAIEALPQGYQTPVGERGQTLSAGQRQLICFTRAMAADPRILILDEATSSVDTQTELRVQEAIRRLTERRTSFIVAHRLSTVRRADRVLVIEDGRITEEGTHRRLMAAGGRYAKMYWEFIRSE
jgi:ATP-binding cassette subfamily B protein